MEHVTQKYLESAYLSLDNKALHDYYHAKPLPPLTAQENDVPTGGDSFMNSPEDSPNKKVQSSHRCHMNARL